MLHSIPVFGNGASANEERDNGTVQQSSTHEQLMHSLARSYTLANRVRRGLVGRGRKSSRRDEAVLLSCDIIGARYSLVCDIYYPCCSFDILLVHCFAGSTSAGRPTAHVERYTSIPPPTAFQQQQQQPTYPNNNKRTAWQPSHQHWTLPKPKKKYAPSGRRSKRPRSRTSLVWRGGTRCVCRLGSCVSWSF